MLLCYIVYCYDNLFPSPPCPGGGDRPSEGGETKVTPQIVPFSKKQRIVALSKIKLPKRNSRKSTPNKRLPNKLHPKSNRDA